MKYHGQKFNTTSCLVRVVKQVLVTRQVAVVALH